MKTLGNEVDKIIKKIFKRQHPLLAELIVNWGKIVGIKYSKHSYPMKIITSKEKGNSISILQIAVENPSLSMEMSFQQDIILERIAIYLGYKAIHKIKLNIRS